MKPAAILRLAVSLGVPVLALAACSLEVHRPDASDQRDAVHIALAKDGVGADHVSMKLPFVDAAFKLPGLGLADHMDVDGIRLAPDTIVRAVDVRGGHGERGEVRVDFTNPRRPADLLDFYRQAAGKAGYMPPPGSSADALTASKGRQQFELSVAPEGNGSRGRIAMRGDG